MNERLQDHSRNQYFTVDDERKILELLYGPEGYYNHVHDLFDSYGHAHDRSRVIDGYDEHFPLAVFGQQAGDKGLITITVGETPLVINENRWKYRVLIPPETEKIMEQHISEHQGGRFTNHPPISRLIIGGQVSYSPGTKESFDRFSKLYVSTLEEALTDMSAILTER